MQIEEPSSKYCMSIARCELVNRSFDIPSACTNICNSEVFAIRICRNLGMNIIAKEIFE